jgi:hypothetical protein
MAMDVPSALNVAALALPWAVLAASVRLLGTRRQWIPISLAVIGVYVLMMASVGVRNHQIESRLEAVQSGPDGNRPYEALSDDAKAAFDDFQNDTGRALAPITAVPFSLMYCALVFGLASLVRRWLMRR